MDRSFVAIPNSLLGPIRVFQFTSLVRIKSIYDFETLLEIFLPQFGHFIRPFDVKIQDVCHRRFTGIEGLEIRIFKTFHLGSVHKTAVFWVILGLFLSILVFFVLQWTIKR